jgi:hypothetical protein
MTKQVKRFAILFAILLSSCTTKAPDVPQCRGLDPIVLEYMDAFGVKTTQVRPHPVCYEKIKEARCGECIWTISDKTQFVGEEKSTWLEGMPWSQLEKVSVKVPPKAVATVKDFIVDTCKSFPSTCSQNPEIGRWRVKLDYFTNPLGGN